MALFDPADLLGKCKRYARLPEITEWPLDDDWWSWLTEAEAKWKPVLALHAPGHMIVGPIRMITTDGGVTYRVPGGTGARWNQASWNGDLWNPLEGEGEERIPDDPPALYFEALSSYSGPPLIPGAYWDAQADYVNEGYRIRMCRGRARSFGDGPYARFVPPAGEIGPDMGSSIRPESWRILLVFDALERCASAGGLGDVQDPDYWRGKIQKELFGDTDIPGDIGILGRAKLQDSLGGLVGRTTGPLPGGRSWWQPA